MAKVYKKGRYGSNVVEFKHPYCYVDEVTGIWINEKKLEANERMYGFCWHGMEPRHHEVDPKLKNGWPRYPRVTPKVIP
jgi:hypothetical protein